jgi:hypothetical protein
VSAPPESVAAAPAGPSRSFWTSAGGILTGAATLVSAFGGIFTALYLAPKDHSQPQPQPTAVTQTVEQPAQTVEPPAPPRRDEARVDVSAVAAYVDTLDTLLASSGDSRAELNDLIPAVESQAVTHAEAVSRIEDVIDERRALLAEVSRIQTPDDFRRSRARLREAIALSVEVDRDVRTWIDAFFAGADHSAAKQAWVAGSAQAQAAKDAFKAEYNAARARFDLGTFTGDV